MKGTRDLLRRMHAEDLRAVSAVGKALPEVEKAALALYDRLAAGGRWINVGAGTSGRLGVLDAAELSPTFGIPEGLVTALIAGGPAALCHPAEGAEDDRAAGVRDLAEAALTAKDAVVGLAASGTTPYVLGAVDHARETGALTVGIACTPGTPLLVAAEIAIFLETGAEAVWGSTRLKAGTAQKLVLNMLSTAVMSRLGLVVDGEMVAMRPTNEKLRGRAVRIVGKIAGVRRPEAEALLTATDWDLPAALVASRFGITPAEARERLARHRGSVAATLSEMR